MGEVFSTTLATDSTLLTVELLLGGVVVPEIADGAEVVAELESTAFTLG